MPAFVGDVLLDSFLDTLKVLPFLVFIYILIELMEQKTSLASENSRLKGKLGVLVGSATGLVPQCGFSVMAAKLYDGGYIALGTLIAIFISTSDEAFIILLADGAGALSLLPVILVKIIVGVTVGYGVNGVLALWKKRRPTVTASDGKVDKADYHARVFRKKEEGFCTSCGRDHDDAHPALTYFVFPLLHSLKVAAYIFVVTAAFGLLVEGVGEENFAAFMEKSVVAQPFITAAIGLIPNCAASVVITESYLLGHITLGSCIAGLCSNAGLGFVILLKNTKKWKRNLLLLVGIYAVGVATGLICNGIETVLPAGIFL